jgi:hypothetical protein
MSSYSKKLDAHVRVKVKYGGAKFSASADFKMMQQGLKNSNTEFISSTASCTTHTAALD